MKRDALHDLELFRLGYQAAVDDITRKLLEESTLTKIAQALGLVDTTTADCGCKGES